MRNVYRVIGILAMLFIVPVVYSGEIVFRCVAADSRIIFQAKPCPIGSSEKRMRLQSAPLPAAQTLVQAPTQPQAEAQTYPESMMRTQQDELRRQAQMRLLDEQAQEAELRQRQQLLKAHPLPQVQAVTRAPVHEMLNPRRYAVDPNYSTRFPEAPSGSPANVPLPECPSTYETGENYTDSQRRPADMPTPRARLPTRTYLKNAGRWPKHCPQ